jgi:hypothetical protein
MPLKPTAESFLTSITSALRSFDYIRVQDQLHRMHLPHNTDGSNWITHNKPIEAMTVHQSGQFFAVLIERQSYSGHPTQDRITLFFRCLRRMGEPSSNTPHLTFHSSRVNNGGFVVVHPKVRRTERASLAKLLKPLGLTMHNSAIAVATYKHPSLFPKLFALCSAVASVKTGRHLAKVGRGKL